MPTTTTNFGWTVPSDTDLVKDGAAAIRTALGGPDTSFVDLKGGTTGQVLSKASGTDLDFSWVAQDDSNAIQNAIVDAKGDLISATAADTPARLAVGTNGQVLTADSTTATGLKWAAAATGGISLLTTTALTGTSVTVGSIDQTYTNLLIIITGMSSSSDYAPQFQYNGVTSGYFGIGASDGSTANTRISGGTYLDAAFLDIWEGSNPNSIVTYYIPNYTATGYHTITYQGAYLNNLDTMRQFTASGGNTNTSAVSSITLKPDAGSFNAGSFRAAEAASMPTVINLTVNGAFDSEGTARTIINTLNDGFYRGTGGATNLQLA